MATLKLGGRFGNHLHRIAAAYALSLKLDERCKVPYWRTSPHFPNFKHRVKMVPANREPTYRFMYCQGRDDFWAGSPLPTLPSQTCLVGCFESAKYFEGYEDEVRDLFYQPVEPRDAIGIHVRRGDFLGKTDIHTRLNMEYYRRAAALTSGRKYIVCSDDIPWCQENFTGPRFTFSRGNFMDDFRLLRSCRQLIISNSTFSWWAAYLCDSPEIVVAPEKWYRRRKAPWKTVNTDWTLV